MPKVSVIVPVYNVKNYLKQCLNSVINQTLKDIEIICIDDGSTDGSENILDEYAAQDNRIRVVHKENTGYGNSMNVGISKAEGEYIGIIESDDFADETMFEKLYLEAKVLDAEIVKSDYFNHFKFEDVYFKVFFNASQEENVVSIKEDFSMLYSSPSIWSAIYKKDFLLNNNINFNETPGASYQDTSFYIKCLLSATKIGYLQKAFVHYRNDSFSSSVHSSGKVFCICDEHDEIDSYVQEYMNDNIEFKLMLQAPKFGRYMWNLQRLGEEYRLEFLERFISEFQFAKENNLLYKDYWPENLWSELLTMLSDSSSYINDYLNKTQKNNLILKSFLERIEGAKNIYIYGAGVCSKRFLRLMPEIYDRVNAFMVTEKEKNDDEFLGKKVASLHDCDVDIKKDLVLVAVGQKNQYSVRKYLVANNIENYIVIDDALRDAMLNR